MRLLMMTGDLGFLRFAPLCGAGVAVCALALTGRWDAAVSFVGGSVAVVLPLVVALRTAGRKDGGDAARRAVGHWAVKFSLTVLLLAVVARGLGGVLLLNAPGFLFGVVVGVVVNVFVSAKMALVVAEGGGR